MEPVNFTALLQQLDAQVQAMLAGMHGTSGFGPNEPLHDLAGQLQASLAACQKAEQEAEALLQQELLRRQKEEMASRPTAESADAKKPIPKPRPAYPNATMDIWDPGLSAVDDESRHSQPARKDWDPDSLAIEETPPAPPPSHNDGSVGDENISEFDRP